MATDIGKRNHAHFVKVWFADRKEALTFAREQANDRSRRVQIRFDHTMPGRRASRRKAAA